ncbi:hypothetical protein F5Y18DRAFT_367880 [Xylariaceae sp. FL1019]|nr:hypothetical protein F5Y18DRAFT_367880 [Xylariaceae sp. FL1019]
MPSPLGWMMWMVRIILTMACRTRLAGSPGLTLPTSSLKTRKISSRTPLMTSGKVRLMSVSYFSSPLVIGVAGSRIHLHFSG